MSALGGGPGSMQLVASVVATNALLTLLFVFLFGLTSEVFNSTIDEHRGEVEAFSQRLLVGPLRILSPVAKLDGAFDRLSERGRQGAIAHGLIVLAVVAIVYGLLSTDWGLNEQTFVMLVATTIGAGLLTYVNYGGKGLILRNRYRAQAVTRLYGTAIIVAAVCVLASRVGQFHPGIIYGFVASTVLLTPVALTKRDEARIILLPSAVLLVISLVSWLLLGSLESAANSGGVPEAIAYTLVGMLFVAGLEGLLFNLLPIRFMDGAKVMKWSRVGWGLTFGLVVFLWWQLLINRDKAYVDALTQTAVGPVLALLAFFALTTGIVWLFFHLRDRGEEEAGEGGEAAEAAEAAGAESVTMEGEIKR